MHVWFGFSRNRNLRDKMSTRRVPDNVPTPAEDCQSLEEAFKGWGTDEKKIIRVLGCRNESQRKKIRDTYQHRNSKSLIDCLHSELSGDFRKAVILWTYDPPERDARLANEALKSKKKDINQLQVVVEIACASSPHHLMAVRKEYCSLFDCSLEEDITANVSLPLRKVTYGAYTEVPFGILLVLRYVHELLRKAEAECIFSGLLEVEILLGLVSSYRFDREVVDLDVAGLEAAKLHGAIKAKQLDQDNIMWILCARNAYQLKATFECYRKNYGNPIDQDIKKCGKGILESILKVVIWCIDSPEKHFAKVIRDSIIGFGTDEDSLTRVIVTRAEIDMMKIRGEYFTTYKSSLDKAVIDDTSGDYRDLLKTLLGDKI